MSPIGIHRERSLTDGLLRVSDAAAVLLGFLAAAQYPRVNVNTQYWLAAAITILVLFTIGEFTALYRNWRGVATYREIATAVLTLVYSFGILLAAGFLTRYTDHMSRVGMGIGLTTISALFAVSRLSVRCLQRWYRSHGYGSRKFAIVGVNELAVRLARNLEDSPEFGLTLTGFYDDRPTKRTGPLPLDVGERLGKIQELVNLARRGEVDRIYITLPMRAEKRTRELLNQLADTTASVYIVPDFFVFELLHSRWTDINGLPVVSVFENPFYGVDGLLKRVVDMCLATAFLGIAALPMMVIAGLIKLTSRGPVFFRQLRYGLDGREIRVWKFRSMSVCENDTNVKQATANDARVTKLGGLLRRSSLDELPQLFNVLNGSMSLVGPRPHATAHNEQYRRLIPGYRLRHKVKPGITGLAQVLGWRGETDTLDKMVNRIQCDLQYIREWSLWMDFKIILKTATVVVSGKNAY